MQNPVDIRELQERVERESSFVDALTLGMNQVIVGQKHLRESVDRSVERRTHPFGRCTGFGKDLGN